MIRGLVDKSVVLPAGAGRYRLLDSVREYGAARLAEAGEDAECRERYLARYLSLTREFSHRLVADGQRDRLGQLRAEHANIRGALEYGLAGRRARRGGDRRAAAARGPPPGSPPRSSRTGSCPDRIREGMRWQDKALDRFAEPSPERASALANRALLGTAVGVAEAVEAGQRGDRHGGTARRRADARPRPTSRCSSRSPPAGATRRRSRWRSRRGGGLRRSARSTRCAPSTCSSPSPTCTCGTSTRRSSTASACCAVSGPGERWLRGNAHALSALAYYQQPGRQAECASAASAALRATQEIGYLVGEAYSLEVLAWLAADAGRCQRAAWLLGAAQALWERTGGRLSGSAVLEGYHQRAAAIAAGALGTREVHRAARGGRHQAARADRRARRWPAPTCCPSCPPAGPADEPERLGSAARSSPRREREIAVLVARGLSNRDIAERLVISKRTVDAHVNHIFGKLGLSSRVQLTIWLRDRTPGALVDELSPAVHA